MSEPRAGFDREAPPDEAAEITMEMYLDAHITAAALHNNDSVAIPLPMLRAIREHLAAAPRADPDYWLARAARLEAALRTCHEVLSEFAWAVREDDTDEGIASRFRPRLGQIREAQETALAALDPEDAAARAPRRGP